MGILKHFIAHVEAVINRADTALIEETQKLFGEALEDLETDVAMIKEHIWPAPTSSEAPAAPVATPTPAPVPESTESTAAAPSPAPVDPAQASTGDVSAAPVTQEVSQ